MKKGILILAVMALSNVTSGCSNSSDFKPLQAKAVLQPLTPSKLVVIPKEIESGYFLTNAQVDLGPQATPLTGQNIRTAKRFMAEIAMNGKSGKNGGYLDWCVSRPKDFNQMCNAVSDTVYFHGKVNGLEVILSGMTYPNPPKQSNKFTSDLKTASWVK